jgi:hypothetical protein
MRWRFADPADAENATRAKVLGQIDRWWKDFTACAPDFDAYFRRGKEMDVPDWMATHLQVIDHRLCWEFGPGLKGGHRLVITPEVDRHLRPLVDVLLQRAPAIKGWEFYPYRLSDGYDQALAVVKGRTGGSLVGVEVAVLPGEGGFLDLTYFFPEKVAFDEKKSASVAFLATESLLGEQLLDEWIGVIEARPASLPDPAGASRVPASELRTQVAAVLKHLIESLPSEPRYLMGPQKGFIYKLEPEKQEDYPSRLDLYVAPTTYPEMWKAAHGAGIFYSGRFSSCGETFCYLKLDGRGGLDEEKFPDKASIEDALDAALKPAEAGCVIGGGTGNFYSYIDLALTDMSGAIPIIRRVLRSGNITKRAWLLFFDDTLQSEWIGIWKDTPPPPGLKE